MTSSAIMTALAVTIVLAGCERVLGLQQLTVIDATGASDAHVGPSVPQLVQQMTAAAADASTLSVTLPEAPTSPHVFVMIGGAESGVTRVAGGGVQWQVAAHSAASPTIFVWYGVTDGSSATVTLTMGGTQGATNNAWVDLTEWSGLATTNTLDAGEARGAGAAPDSSGTVDLSISTARAPDLVVLAIASYGSIGDPSGSWASLSPAVPVPITQQAWYQVANAPGAEAARTVVVGGWDAALVAFHTPP